MEMMSQKQNYKITTGTGNEFWKIFVNGVWFDDDEAMSKKFWGENIQVDFLDSSYGQIIWCRVNTVDDSCNSDCFYVPEGTTVSEIVRAMTYMFKKPKDEYDLILDGGRGFNASAAADAVYNEFDRSVIFKNPEFIDALNDIRQTEQFEKRSSKFQDECLYGNLQSS